MMNEDKILKRYPLLKNRSIDGVKKISATYMDWSSKLYLAVLLALMPMSLAYVVKLVFSENLVVLNIDTFVANFNSVSALFICLLSLALGSSYMMRNWSREIDDYIERKERMRSFRCLDNTVRRKITLRNYHRN